MTFFVFSILQKFSTGYPFFKIGFLSKICIKMLSKIYMKLLSNITLNQSTWSITCLFLSSSWTYWLPSHSLLWVRFPFLGLHPDFLLWLRLSFFCPALAFFFNLGFAFSFFCFTTVFFFVFIKLKFYLTSSIVNLVT